MTRGAWESLLNRCPHTTVLQSFYYAQAMREVHYQQARHGVIIIDGVEAGIVQIQENSLLWGGLHVMTLDRGPLWFNGFGSDAHWQGFAEALNAEFPKRFGRKRRFMPEYWQKDHKQFDLWTKSDQSRLYKTYFMDLTPELDKIRSKLKQKWRNILNKSEKKGLTIQIDDKLVTFGQLLRNYTIDRADKNYAGASTKFLASLAKFAGFNGDCLILNALQGQTIIASILVFKHGKGATYQVGWTNDKGRESAAHHLLLWEAVKILKGKGIITFDLGGYNDETEGVKRFKKGLGGQDIELIGRYC